MSTVRHPPDSGDGKGTAAEALPGCLLRERLGRRRRSGGLSRATVESCHDGTEILYSVMIAS